MSVTVNSVTGNPEADLQFSTSSSGYVCIAFSNGTSRIYDISEIREALAAEERAGEEARRARRRNELADEFTAVRTYGGQLPYTQKLIDRIIELEERK